MKPYLAKHIAELRRDVATFERMEKDCARLLERNTEASTGSCLLGGIEVLIAAAVFIGKTRLIDNVGV